MKIRSAWASRVANAGGLVVAMMAMIPACAHGDLLPGETTTGESGDVTSSSAASGSGSSGGDVVVSSAASGPGSSGATGTSSSAASGSGSGGAGGAGAGASSSAASGSSGSSGSSAGSSSSGGGCVAEAIQPCYGGPSGTQGLGVCHGGTQACMNGAWGACVGDVGPSAETCNGADDDCNGLIDDGASGVWLSCSTGKAGACAAGTTTCMGGQIACAQNTPASPEICNGVDDNCDGSIDDGNPGGGTACATGKLGACAAGMTVCAAGQIACAQSTPVSPEICNGIDDNCNGSIDEGNPGGAKACATGKLGACAAGTTTCAGGQIACTQSASAAPEICNGIDDDCDGVVDDANPGGGVACATGKQGACAAGTTTCAGGQISCAQSTPASPETCNGIDDNCDGAVDNGVIGGGLVCSTGKLGACAAGTMACAGGQLACAQSKQPGSEICNGLDDDCNGLVDDGPAAAPKACSTGQLGVCAAGMTLCSGGQIACIQSTAASSESCNSADDDCNGVVDDGCGQGHVQFVSPYVGIENVPGTLIARGTSFNSAGPTVTVLVGALEIGPLATDSDTQLTLSYPALPAGIYPISIKNALGTSAQLVVLALPAMSAHFISAPSTRRRLVYDAERQTLYAVNQNDQEIERYQYAAGSWTTPSPYILPEVNDLDLAPDGRSLIASTDGTIQDIQLTTLPFVAVQRWVNYSTFCGKYMDGLAVLNDGKAFVISSYSGCSGFSDTYLYDISTYAMVQNPYPAGILYNGRVGASLDGSRAYAGSNGVSPAQNLTIFNSLTDSITTGAASYNLYAVTVSGNASRVILQNGAVYSRSLSLTGNLPAGGVALASRDSSKAFVYRDDGGQPRVVVHDLTGPLLPGAIYPTLNTVNLTISPNSIAANLYGITMASTPDDAVVFVSGDSGIAVVPVN